jgi:hypothetical protein
MRSIFKPSVFLCERAVFLFGTIHREFIINNLLIQFSYDSVRVSHSAIQVSLRIKSVSVLARVPAYFKKNFDIVGGYD